MAEDSSDKVGDGKLDLVPMIDCIMLLLLFFILTTKFTPEDLALASLLPINKGEISLRQQLPIPPPQQIMFCIVPAGMAPGHQPSHYLDLLHALEGKLPAGGILDAAELHLGGDEPLAISGAALRDRESPQLTALMAAIHDYVFAALERRERPGLASRKEQDPVVIRCFSRLPWKFALIAYDAVRDFEKSRSGVMDPHDPGQWGDARSIDFSPPLIRDFTANALGEELFEIVNQR
jgi:Biopolymer transport protein ExbD/TolR